MSTPQQLLVAREQLGADGREPIAALIGADFSALSITSSDADRAPHVVRSALPRFAGWDSLHRVDLNDRCVVDLGDVGARAMEWETAFDAIGDHVGRALALGHFLIALGGDHSVTWPLVAAAAGRWGRVGIVQLDVHHDVRALDDGPSNGTPIRGLIESGIVQSRDVVQIGIHPFGNRRELGAWCEQQGIHRISLDELARDGVDVVAVQAIQQLTDCDALWLTVDIDVLDRAFAPGTVAALPGGIDPATLASLVRRICRAPKVRGMDVVEFDPERDVSSITAYNVAHVVMCALSEVTRRS